MPRQLVLEMIEVDVAVGILPDRDDVGDRFAPRKFVGVVFERTDEHDRTFVARDGGRETVLLVELGRDREVEDPHHLVYRRRRTRSTKDHRVLVVASDRVEDDAARAGVPSKRVAIRFDLTDLKEKNRFWVVLDRADTEVCLKNPGGHEDVVVTTDSESLMQWHTGSLGWEEARRRKLIVAEGPARLIKSMGTWGLSPFAEVEKAYPA